ncbi:hypothetical protein ACFE04_023092 [Oxalis oulophora]
MDKLSDFEKVYAEKISELENKLKTNEDEFQKKDKTIAELEARLEAKPYLQKTLAAKDMIIQNLISEKEKLHLEVDNLGVTLQRIQETVKNMDEQDKKVFSSMLVCQEECGMDITAERDRIDDELQDVDVVSQYEASRTGNARKRASPLCQEHNSAENHIGQNNILNSCVSEDNRRLSAHSSNKAE